MTHFLAGMCIGVAIVLVLAIFGLVLMDDALQAMSEL